MIFGLATNLLIGEERRIMTSRINFRQPEALWDRIALKLGDRPRQKFIALTLVAALLAFEAFNFDTTKFALGDLLGGANFFGVTWAAILAFAFCAIDFAGLIKIFTPEQGADEPKEVWYLMGAWLLGATMNAIMTWYAVSLILMNQATLGNELLSRTQMLQIVPIFVAVLVWLTRILFIGSLSVAGDQLLQTAGSGSRSTRKTASAPASRNSNARPAMGMSAQPASRPQAAHGGMRASAAFEPERAMQAPAARTSRVKRRPPMPQNGSRPAPAAMIAKPRR